jgi:hypothetical protein
MHATRLTAFLGVLAAGCAMFAAEPVASGSDRPTATRLESTHASGAELETNVWPVWVHRRSATGPGAQWNAGGPLLFGRIADDDSGSLTGFRPFWVQQNDSRGQFRAGYFLYPVFSYRVDENSYQWNVLELIRKTGRRHGAARPVSHFEAVNDFEVWPFWFSRETGDPEMSYRALFPLFGSVKNKLGFDQASWAIFPLYLRTEKRDVSTTSVPWPIVRITKGAAHGFGIWPLFEHKERPGVWRRDTYLWPFGYNHVTAPKPEAPPGTPPTHEIGALPFYARRTAAGYRDESYLWPFFGYTDRTLPARYHETRYFWPLLVQGRGDRFVNRWGPFYTHSVVKGYDKTWYAWPLVRHAEWSERNLTLSKTQVFYFLYWSETQRSATHPEKPAASLTHLWPIYSRWDNGAGQKQFQLFSPLEVFFPGNEKIRAAWSPLFAIARREQSAAGEERTSLLWNAVTWRRSEARHEREFHVGPLYSSLRRSDEERIALGNGLVTFHRSNDAGWKVHWLDFPSKSAQREPASLK